VRESRGLGHWERRGELPFEPARGYHATIGEAGERSVLCLKGAPEIVLPRCTQIARRGRYHALDDDARARLEATVERLGRKGLRVLAVAQRDASARTSLHDRHVHDLAFLGFVALSDPVRPTAGHAVNELRRAGVGVVMMTGDHPSTAEGIGAELDLLDHGVVLTGDEVDVMGDDELDAMLDKVAVFARVTPTHKVRIVQAYQRAGRAVAMTGDGANDAPAIRLADVGIALGERSTAAARDAADLIVTDERIETIVDAVIEGRAMWSSVRDAIAVLVGGNVGEVAFTIGGTLATGTPPLNARQLLLVNLLTDAAPAMAIAMRRPRRDTPESLLTEGPEASLGDALTRAILLRGATTATGAGLAYTLARLTGRPRRASTVGMVALTAGQFAQTVAVGGRDPYVLAAGIGSTLLLGTLVMTPGVSRLVGCTPIGPVGWGIAISCAVGTTVGAQLLPRVVPALAPAQR
jgi:cation-transporting ATPase I